MKYPHKLNDKCASGKGEKVSNIVKGDICIEKQPAAILPVLAGTSAKGVFPVVLRVVKHASNSQSCNAKNRGKYFQLYPCD